jgi:hypothetical protein
MERGRFGIDMGPVRIKNMSSVRLRLEFPEKPKQTHADEKYEFGTPVLDQKKEKIEEIVVK